MLKLDSQSLTILAIFEKDQRQTPSKVARKLYERND
jgi:hypothetical protein